MSYTHSRAPVQRPAAWLCTNLLSQLTVTGAAARGSPMATTFLSNLTTIWRTRATSPCGDTDVMDVACADRPSAAQPKPATQRCNVFFTELSPRMQQAYQKSLTC